MLRFAVCLALLGTVAVAQSAPDGRDLFLKNCATCHGTAGKGDGPGAGVPPPRDLTSGRFSFGTTREALLRTVRGGIAPGMPGFRDSLRTAQIDAVVDYVRSLMPAAIEAPPERSTVVVTDRARIVRGALPADAAGGASIARGLAVGLPGGVSLQYSAEHGLRPLCALHSGFVDRTDWRGRGGTPLQFLGETLHPILPLPADLPQVALAPVDGEFSGARLRLQLRRTREQGASVELVADLLRAVRRLGTWSETLAPLEGGYARRLELAPAEGVLVDLRLALATGLPSSITDLGAARRIRHSLHAWSWGAGETRELLILRYPHGSSSQVDLGDDGVLTARLRLGDRARVRCEVLRLRGQVPGDVTDLAAFDRELDR